MKSAVHKPLVKTRRWTRKEYGQLIEHGILNEDDPIELVHGQLVIREPQSTPHATAIDLVSEVLRSAFGSGWRVRAQLPMALGLDSEPEPDVVVVRGQPRDFLDDHPSTAALVVEVAKRSLVFDRTVKASLYARHRIPEYWIVNLVDRVVEVHREPAGGARRRAGYHAVTIARTGDRVTPLAAPRARIAVDDLLP